MTEFRAVGIVVCVVLALVNSAAPSEKADSFEDHVLSAADLIHDDHVQEFDKGELVAHAVRGLYRKLDVKVPAALEEKLKKLKGATVAELRALLKETRAGLGQREELADNADAAIAVRAMVKQLDPLSAYLDDNFRYPNDPDNNYLGARLDIDPDSKMLRVVTPFRDGPAYRAGLRAGDLIEKIIVKEDRLGRPLAEARVMVTKGMTLDDVMTALAREAGQRIHLVRRDGDKRSEYLVSLDRFTRPPLIGVGRNQDDSPNHWLDRDHKLAYVRIDRFSSGTSTDLRRTIADLKKQGLKGLVLDLRFNPGGLLREAVLVGELFVKDGLILRIAPRTGKAEEYKVEKKDSEVDVPITCLVNGDSASASEIVAACLQDHQRAVIVGERTRGKGSVQNIFNLSGNAKLKLTTAVMYRPSGKKLDRIRLSGRDEDEWGVSPDRDFRVEMTDAERRKLREQLLAAQVITRREDGKPRYPGDFKDRQLEAALKYLHAKIEKP
jgi:C-terminal peptidase prc